MRVLFWFLLLAAAAVAVALAARISSGYALFVAPPYRLELSLNLLIALAVATLIGVYALLRVVSRMMRLPADVRVARRRAQRELAREKHDAAVVALLEGRFGRTQKLAQEALAIPQSSGLAALVAARAALERRDYAAVEALLGRADARVASLAVPRLMLEAEAKLEQRQPVEALAVLQALRREAGLHTAALRLELRALQSAGRYADIPALVDQLVKRKAYGTDEGDLIRAAAHAAELRARAGDRDGLRTYWARLSDAEQRSPKIALAAARAFLAQGADHEAADAVVRSLERSWDPALVAAYADCRLTDPTRQLEQAERWLGDHNQDATLLRSLGLLCQRHELWGKAQTYLEASLAVEPSYRTHLALGELLARLGRDSEGSEHLAAALKLAVAELERDGT